ncbi:MAG: anthranilate synthase component I [candidate division NC10 bacterium]|nr:anthranilate synthase component I [candidate division NC10 bacterium]
MYTPNIDDFCQLAQHGNLIPIARQILADTETPVSAFRKVDSGNYAFLLESVEGGEQWGRYSFLGANPSLVLTVKGDRAEVLEGEGRRLLPEARDPLGALAQLLKGYRPVVVPGLPRFTGGFVGFLGYDTVRHLERLPATAGDDLGLPDAVFLLTDTLVIFDNVTHRITVLSNAAVADRTRAALERVYRESVQKIEAIIAALRRPMGAPLGSASAAPARPPASTYTQEGFCEAVRRAKGYVQAGDVIQVVLSQRLTLQTAADPFDVYRALRVVNPSPYMYYLRLGDLRIVGSSPEMLVRLEGERIDLRPIAGTRRRGATEGEDGRLEAELLADPKERAEHIMLVDLGRNDVGRIARVGSVTVPELMVVERYSHVMHLVSHVRGVLEDGQDAFSVLAACFPAGTVTGAPKIRAMEIIEELEPVRRGPYAGAVGYISFAGNLDTCITIRTAVFARGAATVQVGAGIVADSLPEQEYEETMNKARAVLRAIALAEAGLE